MQQALFTISTSPQTRKSPYLVDVLVNPQPLLYTTYPLDGRTLTITVYPGQIDLHLAGPHGGQGDTITLPPAIAFDITNALLTQEQHHI